MREVQLTKIETDEDKLAYIRNGTNQEEVNAFDESLTSFSTDKDALKHLDTVYKAKKDAFKKSETDFWKPTEEGDELRGIYLGSVKSGRLIIHAIGTKNAKGHPMAVRFNGSAILTRELKRGAIGQGVRIVYQGIGKTDAGNKLNKFEVSWLE